jgi:hypothetical protein
MVRPKVTCEFAQQFSIIESQLIKFEVGLNRALRVYVDKVKREQFQEKEMTKEQAKFTIFIFCKLKKAKQLN